VSVLSPNRPAANRGSSPSRGISRSPRQPPPLRFGPFRLTSQRLQRTPTSGQRAVEHRNKESIGLVSGGQATSRSSPNFPPAECTSIHIPKGTQNRDRRNANRTLTRRFRLKIKIIGSTIFRHLNRQFRRRIVTWRPPRHPCRSSDFHHDHQAGALVLRLCNCNDASRRSLDARTGSCESHIQATENRRCVDSCRWDAPVRITWRRSQSVCGIAYDRHALRAFQSDTHSSHAAIGGVREFPNQNAQFQTV
jgi:hypothetical protein